MGSGVWGGCFPGPAGGRPFRRGFDGSCDPVRGIGATHGLEVHAFREIGEPVLAHSFLPRPGDGVVAKYRIEFALVHPHLSHWAPAMLLMTVVAVRGRSVKPELVKRVSFSSSPLPLHCAVAQRFPGLDARTRPRGPWCP